MNMIGSYCRHEVGLLTVLLMGQLYNDSTIESTSYIALIAVDTHDTCNVIHIGNVKIN